MWLLLPCAVLQCQTFEETIISDRAEKEAKRRQLEQDALELKSILQVKRTKAEEVLLCQQLGVKNLCHRHCSVSKWPEKVGWCGVVQIKDRQSCLSFSAGADTKPAAGGRFVKGARGEKPVSSNGLGLRPDQGRHREGHGAVHLLIPLPPATDALSPEGCALQHNQLLLHRPGGSLLLLRSAGEML